LPSHIDHNVKLTVVFSLQHIHVGRVASEASLASLVSCASDNNIMRPINCKRAAA